MSECFSAFSDTLQGDQRKFDKLAIELLPGFWRQNDRLCQFKLMFESVSQISAATKRQRAGAVQDASRSPGRAEFSAKSWTAVALHRFLSRLMAEPIPRSTRKPLNPKA
jgi:hypothetical protein